MFACNASRFLVKANSRQMSKSVEGATRFDQTLVERSAKAEVAWI